MNVKFQFVSQFLQTCNKRAAIVVNVSTRTHVCAFQNLKEKIVSLKFKILPSVLEFFLTRAQFVIIETEHVQH